MSLRCVAMTMSNNLLSIGTQPTKLPGLLLPLRDSVDDQIEIY